MAKTGVLKDGHELRTPGHGSRRLTALRAIRLLVLARGANLLSFRKERPTQVAAWAGRRSSDRELLSHKGCW